MLTFYLLKTIATGENELGQEIFEHKKVAEFIGYMDMLDGNELVNDYNLTLHMFLKEYFLIKVYLYSC